MKNKSIYDVLLEVSNTNGKGISQIRDEISLDFLKTKFAWLFSANIDDAIIGYNKQKRMIVWYGGEFNQGTFIGVWQSGIFRNGIFKSGEFKGGSFMNGNIIDCVFSYGDFYNGTFNGRWIDGNFYGGNFKGTWENGYWESGTFDGEWIDGEWIDGSIYSKKFGMFINSVVDPKKFKELEELIDDKDKFMRKVA